jgi:hypothetical protein
MWDALKTLERCQARLRVAAGHERIAARLVNTQQARMNPPGEMLGAQTMAALTAPTCLASCFGMLYLEHCDRLGGNVEFNMLSSCWCAALAVPLCAHLPHILAQHVMTNLDAVAANQHAAMHTSPRLTGRSKLLAAHCWLSARYASGSCSLSAASST